MANRLTLPNILTCHLMLILLISLLCTTVSFNHIKMKTAHNRLRISINMKSTGSVSLVGSGPGDPDLLTVQALKLINNADLVIADRLISKEILNLIKCELRVANKKPGCAEEAQDEIYRWTKEAVDQGKKVVRLKIGDPFLFGRGGEEVIEFRKWGVEPQIAPGISSSYCAPLSANIPLTHRGVSNQVLISTGYGKDATEVELPTYFEDRTVVLLMAVGRIKEIAQKLIEKRFPIHTPVAIIENATTPLQRTLIGDLSTIGDVAEKYQAKAPATIVIGEVVNALGPITVYNSLPIDNDNYKGCEI